MRQSETTARSPNLAYHLSRDFPKLKNLDKQIVMKSTTTTADPISNNPGIELLYFLNLFCLDFGVVDREPEAMVQADIECALVGLGVFTLQTKFEPAVVVQQNMGFTFTVRASIHPVI